MTTRVFLLLFILLFSRKYVESAISILPDTTSDRTVQINEIHVIGNKKTKENIILREAGFKKGETYQFEELKQATEAGRKRIYNTNLFNEVEIQILETEISEVDLMISVDERWYFYPSPILRLADRNLMDWIINRGGEFNRFNYGLKLDQFNFRGRNERVRFLGEIGFERIFYLNYVVPYIEKTQRYGLILDLAYIENENMAYVTENHLPTFLDSDKMNRKTFNSGISFSYRPRAPCQRGSLWTPFKDIWKLNVLTIKIMASLISSKDSGQAQPYPTRKKIENLLSQAWERTK